jgi:hypothetical protein
MGHLVIDPVFHLCGPCQHWRMLCKPTRSGFFKKAMKNSAPCYSRQKRPDTGSCSWRRAPPAPAPSTAGGFDRSRNSSSCRLGLYVVTLVLVRVLFRHRATCHRHLPLNTRTEFASILMKRPARAWGVAVDLCSTHDQWRTQEQNPREVKP